MTASTRRAALGVLLAAPLTSVPVAANPDIAEHEAIFISLMNAAMPRIREHQRIWSIAHAHYKANEKAFPGKAYDHPLRKLHPTRLAYSEAYDQATAVINSINSELEPYEDLPMSTDRGIVLMLLWCRVMDYHGDNCWGNIDRRLGRADTCA